MASQGWKKKPKKAKRARVEDEQLERMDSLPWNSSLPNDGADNDDPFSFFTGSNDLEGGFLSLEEIDETDYGLDIPKPEWEKVKKEKVKKGGDRTENKKKRKQDDSGGELVSEAEACVEETVEKVDTKVKRKRKRKSSGNKKAKKTEEKVELDAVTDGSKEVEGDGSKEVEGDSTDEAEFYAWNELRLHPLIMKSIHRLGFREPTPIQKACIPAAAHQGKDVAGAAETGSGKTLAFGLPILQRLLEEREKVGSLVEENEEALKEETAPGGFLRALIITPTRELALQVTAHIKEVAKSTNIKVVPIVGGMSTEKQERLLKARPEIVVGTPGRLWELMSGGEVHLVELHSLSFFVLDEADRMIECGHFHELQSIIDKLPGINDSSDGALQNTQNCVTVSSFQRKKRQTFVFSATIALSTDFRKKLKRGSQKSKQSIDGGFDSIESLSKRAGMRENAAVFDLTNSSILADKLEESFIECREEDKDAYLYYILSVHGQGRAIIFCTSIAALRHTSSLMRILGINVWTLHAQMQQRARLKAIDRFRGQENGILLATDVAARGLDIPGVRTVVHYQLPHSAEVYVHRSGRTARASADGCSIALISSNDASKFASLCKSFSKENFQRFPVEISYMPEVLKRLSLARQIDRVVRKESQAKAEKSWFERNAESVELALDDSDSEEERVHSCKQKKASAINLKKLQQELNMMLSKPLQPKTFSRRFLAGAGVSPLLQHQFEELARQKVGDNKKSDDSKRRKLLVIGQGCVEPLQALRNADHESVDLKQIAEKRRNRDDFIRKRKDEKKRSREQRKKERKRLKNGGGE